MFVLLERRSSDVSAIPWRVHGTCVSWPNKSIGTQSCPTPPGRSAGRPDPTRPWYVRVLDSTGGFDRFACSCFWGDDQATCLRCLRGYEGLLSLVEQFCLDPVLPDPAPPSAVRPGPTRPWYVRVLDSTGRSSRSKFVDHRHPSPCVLQQKVAKGMFIFFLG